MRRILIPSILLSILLASCTAPTQQTSPTPGTPSSIPPSRTPRIVMLPTWTPSPTPPRKASPTPRNTATPMALSGNSAAVTPSSLSSELLLDRPTNSQKAKPANLVTLEYDPNAWILNSYYPTSFMGYALNSHLINDCKLEPWVGSVAEGYEVEKYNRVLGATTYQISRFSQAGELQYTNYCTGEGEDSTCYQMTPGTDHTSCTQSAEIVLATYKLIPNPWYGDVINSPNRWMCQDATGTLGLCLISYSVPLNALAFTTGSQAWAAGDDGVLFQQKGQTWQKASSPASHPLYDLSFTSLTDGWSVGDGAEVIKWDGNAWSEVLPYHGPGEGPGGSTQVLFGVDGDSPKDVWLVGTVKGVDGKNSAYALHWNGSTMVEESTLPECNCGLNAVVVIGNDNIFAVGGSDLGAIVFHWNGIDWSSEVLPGADHLYSIIQAPDKSIWAGGIEIARDQSDTRGALFKWDGSVWQRVATPPLTGGIYALTVLPTGQVVLGGDFTALRDELEWQPITTDIAGYGWIVDIEQDIQANAWALTHSGNIFKLVIGK